MKHLIIISVYNKPILTRRCIESIIRTTDLKKNLLFIVDDHSDEKTRNVLDQFSIKYPQVVLRRNAQNIGKPKSVNVALRRYTKMDYYTIIDNDITILNKNWVTILMNAHKDWNDQAILGAYTYMNGYTFTRNGRHYLDPWPYWNLAGCFFSFSKKVFKKLGYFSEVSRRSEDADYCRRAFLAGFRWFYITDIKAHISGYKDLKERNRLAGFQRMEQKKRLAYSNYVMLTHDVYYPPRGRVKKGG
ncbi:glycosyltransferase [Patescibacteria group bacterium AH-259-L07]|nr:glycosyltransferase [Patescibacteria group bacterium AH-259-L07]